MGKLVGYARISTSDQDVSLQIEALVKAGCNDIFSEQSCGARADRPELKKCLEFLSPGDTLVVWRLDRLGRSVPHLMSLIEDLRTKNIDFRSICDGVMDTTTASGELIFNIFSSLAQFERKLIQERTRAGLLSARSRGRHGGRPAISIDNPKVKMAKVMNNTKEVSIREICDSLKISKTTFYRYLSLPSN
jgi:DNA invertase Pin-like site-specific DNA recombinase